MDSFTKAVFDAHPDIRPAVKEILSIARKYRLGAWQFSQACDTAKDLIRTAADSCDANDFYIELLDEPEK